jgi:hypothetical protein
MKYYCLVIILLLVGCTSKEKVSSPVETEHILPADNEQLVDLLILDGRPYVDSGGKAYKKDEAHLITGIICNFSPDADSRWHSFEGMEQLVNLVYLTIRGEVGIPETLDFSPFESLSKLENVTLRKGVLRGYTLKEMKHFMSLKDLSIEEEGGILATLDFSPLASLSKLESINFNGNITRLPDLTMLTNLRTIYTGSYYTPTVALESLEGIGAPNLREISITNIKEIDSFAPLNNLMYLEKLRIEIRSEGEKVHKVADMANLPNLKRLDLMNGYTKIDLHGIENMSSLEILLLSYCEPINIEGIGKLANLKSLYINLISPEPSLEFLRDMPNLSVLYLHADEARFSMYPLPEPDQILDLNPLATVKSLVVLECRYFIIKNISALGILERLNPVIVLIGSRLYDETEKSKYYLQFYPEE